MARTGKSSHVRPESRHGGAVVLGVVGRAGWSRELLIRAIGSIKEFSPVDLGGFSTDLATRLTQARVSVLLMDLPPYEAADLAAKLSGIKPPIRTVALSVPSRVDDVALLAEAGLHAILHKEDSVADLLGSIEAVRRGARVCSSRIARELLQYAPQGMSALPAKVVPSPLSPREHQVVRLLEQGLSNKEIGDRLRIGPGTVKCHVHRILAKFAVHHRWEVPPPTAGESTQVARDHDELWGRRLT